MAQADAPTRLNTPQVLAAHLEQLSSLDQRLAKAVTRAGAVQLRTSPSGFEGMARIICGQQLSVASARAKKIDKQLSKFL